MIREAREKAEHLVAAKVTQYLEIHEGTAYYGRLFKTQGDPFSLEYFCDERSPFPFVMGPETISALKGKTIWEIFDFIGYPRDYVLREIRRGMKYCLVLFTGFDCEEVQEEDLVSSPKKREQTPLLATWGNVLSLIDVSPVLANASKEETF